MPWAAVLRAGIWARASSSLGTITASAATTAPEPDRTGTAIPQASGWMNPGQNATPSRRTWSRVARNRAGVPMVAAVNVCSGPARVRYCRSAPACASSTSPEDDACSGSRPAIRV